MSKKIIFEVSMLLIGLVSVIVFLVVPKNNEDINVLDIKETEAATTIHQSRAMWASNAITVEELMLESDLVVRARVVEAPVTRVVRIEAPMVDENGGVIGTTVIKVLFSDTVFEVVKTYMGNAPSQIAVMQTGGYNPTVSRSVEETADDPLYKVGEEYILFLRDISGDHVHAPDSELYLTVNPSGRYKIDSGNSVFSYSENLQSVQLPKMMSELEAQIEQAAEELKKSDNPLGSGEEVSFTKARRRISYSIPLPEAEEIERVWISINPENVSNQSVAISFKRDLLLIIHKTENEKMPDWDRAIVNEPLFVKIDVNGISGIGADPGVTEFRGQPYYYPGSVEWWVDGLDITLYSDTLSLEELLKIAKTINLGTDLLTPTETSTTGDVTPTPTELLTETPTELPTQTPTPTETVTPTP